MRGVFAYAPPPVADELLGSWIHRVAIAHGVNGSTFLQKVGDFDWSADDELLRWLSRGSGLSTLTLRSLTISGRAPSAARAQFAMAAANCFPGCHAYCVRCAVQDRLAYGEAVLRQANAGWWRMICRKHGVLLDGIDHEDELTPASRRPERAWLDGRLPFGLEYQAPTFVFAFERAMRNAERGRPPGALWTTAAPDAFVEIARAFASLALLRQRFGGFAESAASVLHGGRLASRIGVDFLDLQAIDRASTRCRIWALIATALLMLSPNGADRFSVADWPPLRAICDWRRPASTPWEAAIGPWHWATLDLVMEFTAKWPPRLHCPIEAILAPRMKLFDG